MTDEDDLVSALGDEDIEIGLQFVILRLLQGPEKGPARILPDEGEASDPHRVSVDGETKRPRPIKDVEASLPMKEIKGKLGTFVIAGNDQDAHPCAGELHEGLYKGVQDVPGNVVLVEEITAVDKQIRLDLKGVLNDGPEILKDGMRPLAAPFRVRLRDLDDLKSKVGISGMDEFHSGYRLVYSSLNLSFRDGQGAPC